MNERLLQTFDGLPIKSSNDIVRCSEYNLRLQEGKEVVARFHLNGHRRINGVYCPHCYANNTHESHHTEEAAVEARLITRLDRAEQTTTPAIHTHGSYKLLRHHPGDEDVSTGGDEPKEERE